MSLHGMTRSSVPLEVQSKGGGEHLDGDQSFISTHHDGSCDSVLPRAGAAQFHRDRAVQAKQEEEEEELWCPHAVHRTTSDIVNNSSALELEDDVDCRMIGSRESCSPVDEEGVVTHVCKGLRVDDVCGICEDLDDVSYSHILQWMARLLKIPLCGLILGDGEVVCIRCRSGVYRATRPATGSLMDWLVSKRCTSMEPVIVCDTLGREDFRYDAHVSGNAAIRFYAARPIVMEEEIVGTVFILDRVLREYSDNIRDGLEYFSLIFRNKLTETGWRPNTHGTMRREQLEIAFDTASFPLMIASSLHDNNLEIERVNVSFQHWFGDQLEDHGDVLNALSFALECNDRDAWNHMILKDNFEVGLTKGQGHVRMVFSKAIGLLPESLPANMQEACRMLVRCMMNSSAEKKRYYVVSLKDTPLRLQKTANGLVPRPLGCRGVPWLQDVCVGQFSHASKMSRVYKCTCKGNDAIVTISRFDNISNDTNASAVMDTFMGLPKHRNILKPFRAGTVENKRNTGYGYQMLYEHWVVQDYPDRGSLRDAMYAGLFADEEKKPLFVSLTMLDIARGILQLRKESLLYGEFSTKDIYLQSDPGDQLRGWRAVLACPDISANCRTLDDKIARMHTCSKQSCPERLLGSEISSQSESFCLGLVLWEMWLETEAWPQFNSQDLLHMICFDEEGGLYTPHDMPAHLSRVLSKCLSRKENSRFSVLTVMTLLQDYVQLLAQRHRHSRESLVAVEDFTI